MIVFTSTDRFAAGFPGSVGICATIGNFDGLHSGHRSLLRRVLEVSARTGCVSLAVTFWPHPLSVLAPEKAPELIATREEKLALFAETGVEAFLEIPFDRKLASLTAEEFLETWLLPLGLRHLVTGWDFALGKNRSGDAWELRRLGLKHGFAVTRMPAVCEDGIAVSSTRVRLALSRGLSVLPGMSASWSLIACCRRGSRPIL